MSPFNEFALFGPPVGRPVPPLSIWSVEPGVVALLKENDPVKPGPGFAGLNTMLLPGSLEKASAKAADALAGAPRIATATPSVAIKGEKTFRHRLMMDLLENRQERDCNTDAGCKGTPGHPFARSRRVAAPRERLSIGWDRRSHRIASKTDSPVRGKRHKLKNHVED